MWMCAVSLINKTSVAGSYHLSLHACSKSLFARGLSIDSRVYVISQHVRWPIRTPQPTCTNQDAWVVITPKRPKANSIHIAAWHAWTRTPPRYIVQKAIFSLIHFLASFICLWPLVPFWFGGIEARLGVVRRTRRTPSPPYQGEITRLLAITTRRGCRLVPLKNVHVWCKTNQ